MSLTLTKYMLMALISKLMQSNNAASAVAIALSWSAYLRALEALKVTQKDVAMPGDPRTKSIGGNYTAGISISDAKTGAY